MLRTIRGKVTTTFIATTLFTFIIVNLLIWAFIQKDLQGYIKNDMEGAKNVAVSEIINKYNFTDGKFSSGDMQLWKVLDNINNRYGMYVSLDEDENKNIEFLGSLINSSEKESILRESNKTSSLLYLSRISSKNLYYGTFAYPIYLENQYIGTIVFQKDYLNKYNDNLELMKKIIGVQVLISLIVIIIICFCLKVWMKPLNKLSKAMEQMGEGDFNEKLNVKGNNEISNLVYHFNEMQEKISEQMKLLCWENEKIKALEEESRSFINYATHEMKTPLAAILGYSELLQKGSLTIDEVERANRRIEIEGKRLKSMVENMLLVARNRETKKKISEEFDIAELINKIAEDYNIIYENKNILFEVTGKEFFVCCIKEEMRIVVTNILDNCIKYSLDGKGYIDIIPEKRIITFTNKILIIPENIEKKLFEPFVKYNYGDNSKASSGLGLFICRELIYNNGGEIDYKVEDNKITFSVII